MAKFKERIKARELRIEGWSIKEIVRKLGVSKGTVSIWCRDIRLSYEQLERLREKTDEAAHRGRVKAAENKINERLERMQRYEKLGRDRVGRLNKRDLFIAGIALYWAEGSKKQKRMELINSDPMIIKLWIDWLHEYVNLDRERDLYCRVGINQQHKSRIKDVEIYWSKVTGIPLAVFRKPSYKRVKTRKIYENFANHYGSLCVTARKGTNLLYSILGMIGAMSRFEASHGKI